MGTYDSICYFSKTYEKGRHIMKTTRINNVPVTEGEVTIVRAENAADVMKHSCGFAKASRKAGSGVLILNTGLSKHRFKEAACEAGIEVSQIRDTSTIFSPGTTPLIIQTSVAGELARELGGIRQICEEANIKIVVITGWEWTSSNYRRKEQLIFGLRQLLSDLDIALVVYSQSQEKITCGMYSRGGVGKLAMMAYDVVSYEVISKMEEEETGLSEAIDVRKPQPVVGGGAQLVRNKINELQGGFADKVKGERGKVNARAMALAA